MKKERILSIALIAMVVLNLGTLGFLYVKSQKRAHRKQAKEIIIKRLRFDEGQEQAYLDLIEQHRENLKTLEEQRKLVKERLYSKINQAEDRATGNIKSLGKIQEVIEELHFQHFRDIRELCRADQIPAYDSLSHDLTKIFRPPPPRGPRGNQPKPPSAPDLHH